MDKVVIRSPLVPETGGPFSLAVRHNDLVYVAGLNAPPKIRALTEFLQGRFSPVAPWDRNIADDPCTEQVRATEQTSTLP